MTHVLDNIIWNTIRQDTRGLCVRTEQVGVFHKDIAPFAGMHEYTAVHFNALREVVADHRPVVLFSSKDFQIPKDWDIVQYMVIDQMVYTSPDKYRMTHTHKLVTLSKDHVKQMLELTHLTKPGPFLERTILFDHYHGIFDGEGLVSMAGFRFSVEGYTEISAVCTHPDYLGKGYAKEIMQYLIHKIRDIGITPFLHVRQDNVSAIKVYEQLGFEHRIPVYLYVIKKI